MVQDKRICSFCGVEIEPGTGSMLGQTDGKTQNFCSSKCRKNLTQLRRVPRKTRWSRFFEKR